MKLDRNIDGIHSQDTYYSIFFVFILVLGALLD